MKYFTNIFKWIEMFYFKAYRNGVWNKIHNDADITFKLILTYV